VSKGVFSSHERGPPRPATRLLPPASESLMPDARRWLTFAGGVLIIAVLYWAQVVIDPVAVALLLTFALSPAVVPLQRRLGGVVAVLLVVVVTFGMFGIAGWAVTTQLRSLVQQLPTYPQN